MNFITLDSVINVASLQVDSQNNFIGGIVTGWYGVQGNPYTVQVGGVWVNFTSVKDVPFSCSPTKNYADVVTAANSAVEAYRTANFPNV